MTTSYEIVLSSKIRTKSVRSDSFYSLGTTKILTEREEKLNYVLQVNLCQELLFLHYLTHSMETYCSLNYKFNTWKFQAQNKGRTCCVQKLILTFRTIYVHNMFSPCSELGIFSYWTCNSMNNMSSYCGLVDAKIRASDKDLLTCTVSLLWFVQVFFSY